MYMSNYIYSDNEHCYKCQTSGYHAGVTCLELGSSIDSGNITMVPCPNCSIT